MGEIADEMVDRMLSERHMWRVPRRPQRPSCQYCGVKDLYWSHQYGSEWRLVDRNGKLHNCRAIPSDEGFDAE